MTVPAQNPQTVKQPQMQQQEWFQHLLEDSTLADNENLVSLNKFRLSARQSMKTAPVLNRKQEAWRYNRVDEIFKNNFDLKLDAELKDFSNINEAIIENHQLPQLNSLKLVFVNGCFDKAMSNINHLPDGVILSSIAATLRENPELLNGWFKANDKYAEQPFNALNNALFKDGMYLHIGKRVKLDRPIEIIYLNSKKTRSLQHDGSMLLTRNIIHLQAGASAQLVEYFISKQNNKYFYNNVTEILLAEKAQLKHTRIQDESRMAYHLSSLYVSQKKHSKYHSSSFAFGGCWAKTDYKVEFEAQQSECDLYGLYTVGNQQLIDFHLDVQHSVPSCCSREKFKGLIYGKGRAVFDGRILVAKQAQHSDAALTNDNLLLVKDAEVYTKPQLEIYADDVKCSHGTTVGRLDPQQVFYLRSRGIDEAHARRMLCQGFSEDVVESVELEEVRIYLAKKIASTLNETDQQTV